jgi:hypothetical protein
MHKAVSRKISIFLTGFILLAWVAIVTPSLSVAGMHELSDGQMAAVYGSGFSTFSLTGNIVKIDFSGVTLSTYTTIDSMKMGYYNKSGFAWDNDWTNVKLGTAGADLVAKGLYIEAEFSDITDLANRKLEYFRIGTPNLTGTVTADFNRFSGTIGSNTYTRDTTFGTATITAAAGGTGFNLTLSRNGVGNQMGYSFNWVAATKTP